MTAIMPKHSIAALDAEARASNEALAALKAEAAGIEAATDAEIDADNPALVNRLKRRKGQLPDLIARAQADYDQARQVFGDARERERIVDEGHKLNAARDGFAAQEA